METAPCRALWGGEARDVSGTSSALRLGLPGGGGRDELGGGGGGFFPGGGGGGREEILLLGGAPLGGRGG